MGLEILKLLLALAGVALVLYLCYITSRFLANKVGTISKSNSIRVVERVALTQDKGLAIVEITHKFYLVGFSTNSIEILQELDEEDLHIPVSSYKPSFLDALNSQIKSRLDLKTSDKYRKKVDQVKDIAHSANDSNAETADTTGVSEKNEKEKK